MGLCLVAVASLAGAQTTTATTGAINGSVTDSTKAILAGVTVRLSGTLLLTAQFTLTNDTGGYRFSAVPPRDHTLTFELAGFRAVVRSGIGVGLGFTATVNVEMDPGTVSDLVTVSGASPVVDVSSTGVTTRFVSDTLASLPGSRDFFAVVANTPGVALSKMDVGGNGALSLQEHTAYGLRATTGVNRNEVEGIRIGVHRLLGRQVHLLASSPGQRDPTRHRRDVEPVPPDAVLSIVRVGARHGVWCGGGDPGVLLS